MGSVMPASLATFLAKPLVKFGVPVLIVVIAIVGFRLWLWRHDVSVREAERTRIEQQAHEHEAEARNEADEAAQARNEVFNETRVDNASGPDEYLRRLRANQCHANPSACR
jgi:hypothetical protein